MADKRIERSSIKTTPASAKGIAPLNGQPTPVDPFCEDEIDVNKQEAEVEKDMEKKNFELQLSYKDVLEFLQDKHCLVSLLNKFRSDPENLYNPPSQNEFLEKLNFAMKHSDMNDSQLLDVSSNYADEGHQAFPIDKEHVLDAHTYIHKYWNDEAKKGITATYRCDDFVDVHEKIVSAMLVFGFEHDYMDGLDNVSGYIKDENGVAVRKKSNCTKEVEKMSFNFFEDQTVVSWSRNRMRESGKIKAIDGVVATVQWECGLLTTEPLAGLFPKE